MAIISFALQALQDFKDRIRKYEEVYETITDRNLHYIKLIDMCAPVLSSSEPCAWSCWHLLDHEPTIMAVTFQPK